MHTMCVRVGCVCMIRCIMHAVVVYVSTEISPSTIAHSTCPM